MSVPARIVEIYDLLKTEVTWMHGRWKVYRQLFGTSEQRVQLLNAAASNFFYFVQDVLIDDVQVTLSKITDPPRSRQYENLSLTLLQERIDEVAEPEFAQELSQILMEAKSACEPFRMRRNKKLAHLDLETARAIENPLPGISREMVEKALLQVRTYLNRIEQYYNDAEFGYEHFLLKSDGDQLIAVLKDGLRYEELVQERVIDLHDWRKGKWSDA